MIRRLRRTDDGSITAFVAVLAITFIACAGLAVDGGRLVATRVQLADHAENAARAGVQEVTSLRSGDPDVDIDRARRTAASYLNVQGVSGEVVVTSKLVTVTVRRVVPMTLLGLFGAGSKLVSAQRSASPVTGP
jgi:Flp pilus assembly protein TadG